jgi:protein-S-isoprenylcysteine O-methyltransferase Ste14
VARAPGEVKAVPLRDRIVALRPPRIAMSLVAAAAAAHLLFPLVVLPPSVSGGMLLGTAGFALMIRAWWLFRRVGTHDATTLLTGDVYGFTRNPMYLGIVAITLGVAMSFGTAPFYLAAALLFAVLNFVFCPYEEQRLRRAFPDFDAYAARVRRWI